MNSPTDALGELWSNLLPSCRRALCELAAVEPHCADQRWDELEPKARALLGLGIRRAVELGVDCSRALLQVAA